MRHANKHVALWGPLSYRLRLSRARPRTPSAVSCFSRLSFSVARWRIAASMVFSATSFSTLTSLEGDHGIEWYCS